MRVLYVAHPYGGDRQNLYYARIWYQWLATGFPGNAYVASWILDCESFCETDEDRSLGLERNQAIARRCHGIVLCGNRVSDGMKDEMSVFLEREVYDLTGLGCSGGLPPPTGVLADDLLDPRTDG